MTDEELLRQQKELQEEGNEVLKELNIDTNFSELGKVVVGGSLVSGLMTWRDIDIGVETETMPSKKYLISLFDEYLSNDNILQLDYSNNTSSINPHHPKGIYIGIKYKKEEGKIWKIDLWFIKPENHEEALSHLKWLKENLTPERKISILKIKKQIEDDPRYKKTIFSIDVYKAVIDDDVEDIEGFKKYLLKTNRSLN